MQLTKLDRNAAFVIRDLEDVPCEGPVRLSPKVTQANAKLYARVATYRFALLGLQRGGGAGGIKAETADKASAIEAFLADVQPLVAEGSFLPDPAAGVDAAALGPLREHDPRNPVLWEQVDGRSFRDVAAARSAVACLDAHVGGIDGRSVAVQWSRAAALIVAELHRRGARISAVSTPAGTVMQDAGFGADELFAAEAEHGDAFTTELGVDPAEQWAVLAAEADVFIPLPTLRSVSDQGADVLKAKVVLPAGEQPVAPKPLAALRRRDVVVLPDTVALAGPAIVGTLPEGTSTDDALQAIDGKVAEIMAASAHDDGPLLGSCYVAEEFLRSWRDELPFGRPLP